MTIRPSLILFTLAFLAGPALACGDGSCDPTPPTPDPEPAPQPGPEPRSTDGEPVLRHVTVQYGYCCRVDGAMRFSAPWGSDPAVALGQCRAREQRLEVLPDCPPLLSTRIRRMEARK